MFNDNLIFRCSVCARFLYLCFSLLMYITLIVESNNHYYSTQFFYFIKFNLIFIFEILLYFYLLKLKTIRLLFISCELKLFVKKLHKKVIRKRANKNAKH